MRISWYDMYVHALRTNKCAVNVYNPDQTHELSCVGTGALRVSLHARMSPNTVVGTNTVHGRGITL